MPLKSEKIRVPTVRGEGLVRSDTFNEEERTVEVIWATEAPVLRYCWHHGYYNEILQMSSDAIRMDRLDKGMSVLNSHKSWDMNNRIGTVVPGSVRLSQGKGTCLIKLNKSDVGERIFLDLKDGHSFPVSVGYRVHKFLKEETEGETPDWTAVDWEPNEISAVPVPADAGAHSRSIEGEQEPETYECVLQRNEPAVPDTASDQEDDEMPNTLSEKTADEIKREAKESAKRETDTLLAESKRKAEEETKRAAEEAAEKARSEERTRTTEITKLCREHDMDDEFAAKHIAANSDLNAVRTAILDKIKSTEEETASFSSAPPAEPNGRQDAVETRRKAVGDALLHRHNPSLFQIDDAAREWAGMSLVGMARTYLEDCGVSTRGMSDVEVAKRMFHSTSDFPLILGNVANTTFLKAYETYPSTYEQFGTRTTVANFKPQKVVRLGDAPGLERINEHGEYGRGTMKEAGESLSIDDFGVIIGFTRRALINDELGAFTKIPQMLGAKAKELENDIFWDVMLKNPKMADGKLLFSNDHKNLTAKSNPDAAAIAAARLRMRQQKGLDGKRPLNLRPTRLAIPAALEFDIEKLMGSVPSDDVTKNVPESIKRLIPVVEPRLDEASDAPWFACADPNTIDTIHYAFLSGQEGARVDTKEGWDIDGMELKIAHDFGASAIDHRGLQKIPTK
ncbi:prohead protease/major capsid protein fusion protein [Pseudovibrio ascidiaceicola]|uniref:prohead protease/major capsid protein fusion protein n=1 Tax=Pseudovibrio ascidiaceicola TaxID=285279 RepID=UPI003D36984E